ncbi:MAG: RNA polymerase sigma factor [Cyclobacteriaceae bacterium]|nr:RNA polymerase sigma factor [Cyclobacteriaceae bacterium]
MTAIEFESQISGLQKTLKKFTYRFTRNADESQDLIQDTLLKALLYRKNFKEDTNLKGWLFTIMKNTFINNYRKSKVAKTSVDTTKELYYLNVADNHTFNRPEKTLELKEAWRNINSVKEDLQKPFKLHITGYKYHEISEHLNIPIGTVKNRIFQARKEIQKKILEG